MDTKTLILNRDQIMNFALAYAKMIVRNQNVVPIKFYLVEVVQKITTNNINYIASPVQYMEIEDLAERCVQAFGTPEQIQKFYTINS